MARARARRRADEAAERSADPTLLERERIVMEEASDPKPGGVDGEAPDRRPPFSYQPQLKGALQRHVKF